jgi:hypothetical protein
MLQDRTEFFVLFFVFFCQYVSGNMKIFPALNFDLWPLSESKQQIINEMYRGMPMPATLWSVVPPTFTAER